MSMDNLKIAIEESVKEAFGDNAKYILRNWEFRQEFDFIIWVMFSCSISQTSCPVLIPGPLPVAGVVWNLLLVTSIPCLYYNLPKGNCKAFSLKYLIFFIGFHGTVKEIVSCETLRGIKKEPPPPVSPGQRGLHISFR